MPLSDAFNALTRSANTQKEMALERDRERERERERAKERARGTGKQSEAYGRWRRHSNVATFGGVCSLTAISNVQCAIMASGPRRFMANIPSRELGLLQAPEIAQTKMA